MALYDLAVIGGGSGGMAAAKEAAQLGAKTILFDFVTPTIHGTKWGLGGTCVNVGCVPKKLMHYASLMGPILHHDARHLGWDVPENVNHDWDKLVKAVQNHIRSLNFSYRTSLRSNMVEYVNALATFESPNKLKYSVGGQVKTIDAANVLVAVGGRPIVPVDVPGARDLAISSDDLFSLKSPPGKTLVVGASYIALECAGLLTHLGFPVTVAVRSIPLRGFDQQCAEKICQVMAEQGTVFVRGVVPLRMARDPTTKKVKVDFSSGGSEEFDTVLYATGRYADTERLGLERAGVELEPNFKIKTINEQTNVPNIFAVGDVLCGRPELTPVAIQTGELLARRLFGGSKKLMDFDKVPTTVFTPVEYGCVGLSEEAARAKFGDRIEVFLQEFNSLELGCCHREKSMNSRKDELDVDASPHCLSKLIVDTGDEDRILGFHFVGPNAGEMTQGFALGLRLGAKKADFDDLVGIHPTDAESFTSLSVTKSSGKSWVAAGGCGGGKCG